MGMILTGKCPCGVKGEVESGSGMTEGSACLPAWCKRCKRLVSAPVQQGAPHCGKCHAPVDVIELYDPTGLRETVPEEPVVCPRCGEKRLRFEFAGIWD